ncbi:MAG: DUF4838 domain-containing protein [Verrucomicrobia bacterium]|nr:DUF4838 domain-containing protein [Verrucomicrobiota bacterium]
MAPALMVIAPFCACAQQVVIARDGVSSCVIVLGKTPSSVEQRAAVELRHYLRKISGVEIPISSDAAHRIVLGTPNSNPAINEMLKGQTKMLTNLGDEGFLLKTIGMDLVITGNSGDAVLHGVYGFLEKYLGCRWFAKGELGEAIPKRNNIILQDVDHTEKPAMRLRNIHMCGPGHYDEAFADWMSRNKMNAKTTHHSNVGDIIGALKARGIKPDTSVHSFAWYVPASEYFASHPEYFILFKGKRAPGTMGYQLCLSNPEVIRIFIEKSKQYLASHPYLDAVGIGQNDGGGWCECDQCNPMGKSPADRLVVFVNAVAEGIGKACPGKLVAMMAYGDCNEPPRVSGVKLRANVRVDLYANRCYTHALNDPKCKLNVKAMEKINGWLAVVGPERLVWGDMSDDPEFLPCPKGRTIAEDLRWMANKRMAGFIGATMPEWWENMKLYYCAAARASWDPSVSYDTILDDFCARYYGGAGGEMKKYFLSLEERSRKTPDCERWGTAGQYYSDLFPSIVLRELAGRLDKAQALARGDEQAEQRVAAEQGLCRRYTQHLIAIAGREDIEKAVAKGRIANLIVNPGFETGLEDPWGAERHEGAGKFDIEDEGAPEGKQFIRITCADDKSYLRVAQQDIPVKKGHRYYFSVWVKADEGVSGPIWLNQDHHAGLDKIAGYTDTRGKWQKVVIPEFIAARDKMTIFLENRYPKKYPGSVCFDNVIFVDLETVK